MRGAESESAMKGSKMQTRRGLAIPVLCLCLILAACAGAGDGPRGGAGQPGAISLESLDADGHVRMAERLEKAGDLAAALSFYRRADEKRPDDPDILAAMGDIHFRMGDAGAARRLWERALAKAPDNMRALLGTAFLMVHEGKGGEAARIVKQVHVRTAPTARSLNLLGVAEAIEGHQAAARRAYAEALVLSPEDPDILSNLALSMAVAGESEAARDILRSLARDDQQAESAIRSLALVAALDGRVDEAVAYAAEIMPAEQAFANKPFYRAIGGLSGIARARAVFLGEVAEDQKEKEPAQDDTGHVAQAMAPDPRGSRPASVEAQMMAASDPGAGKAAIDDETVQEPPIDMPGAPRGVEGERAAAEDSLPEPMPTTVPEERAMADDEDSPPDYHLQLGAFSSMTRLARGWKTLASVTGPLGLNPYYETFERGGETLYRLLSGPVKGMSAGRAICARISDAGGACVVIPLRPDPLPLDAVN